MDFLNNDIVHGSKKVILKELCFIFNNILCKQIDRVVMGSLLGP